MPSVRRVSALLLPLAFACTLQTQAQTQSQLSPDLEAKVVAATEKVVHDSGVPSASVGIIQNGRIVYAHAFGFARLQPPQPASADMPYPIGSISKQFTATAILLLQQQGKLSVDDPVAKYFPELTRASDIRLRNLLTMSSGYQDYAPQDYTIPAWRLPNNPLRTVREFAGKPLDFEPGTQWQYSNTNFVLLALIVEKVSGQPFADFLRQHVLEPAGLQHVLNLNSERDRMPVTGYMRNALAPLRPAVLEGPGWYFGDADLAMPVASLLAWDQTFLRQSLLTPDSYRQMETAFTFTAGDHKGESAHYGFGIFVTSTAGHRILEHSGEVGGFVAENMVLPGDGFAVAVLTNQEASNAASDIAHQITRVLMPEVAGPATPAADTFAPKLQSILTGLQHGQIDRTLFTPDCNDYFSPTTLADFQSSLSPFGAVVSAVQQRKTLRGGMTFELYKITFTDKTAILVTLYLQPDGKIEQLLVEGKA